MSTLEAQRLIRKLATLLVLVLCLTFLVNTSRATASQQKARLAICCSLCNGEPTDPGACHYGCRPSC
jgi:hypothetical protein